MDSRRVPPNFIRFTLWLFKLHSHGFSMALIEIDGFYLLKMVDLSITPPLFSQGFSYHWLPIDGFPITDYYHLWPIEIDGLPITDFPRDFLSRGWPPKPRAGRLRLRRGLRPPGGLHGVRLRRRRDDAGEAGPSVTVTGGWSWWGRDTLW